MTGLDVRGHGFADLTPLAVARAWIDAEIAALPAETVGLDAAIGRVLAADLVSDRSLPPLDQAAVDGYAVRAEDTLGAATFTPVALRLVTAPEAFGHGAALAVGSGDAMPAGADAVVLVIDAEIREGMVEIVAARASGSGVEAAGSLAVPGRVLVERGRRLGPAMMPLLVAAGVERIAVHRRPRARLLTHRQPDGDGPMIAALLRAAGAEVEGPRHVADRRAFEHDLGASAADLIVAIGRTGPAPDDWAPVALADAGRCIHHGFAIQPGTPAALGRVGDAVVLLAPGRPAACLAAWHLLGRPMIERLAGCAVAAERPIWPGRLRRKLASLAGFTEVEWVRRAGRVVEPLVAANAATLAQADGHVIMPEASEGFAAGADVMVVPD